MCQEVQHFQTNRASSPIPPPTTFWRSFAADEYDEKLRQSLIVTLATFDPPGLLWRRALGGDPASAVGVVLQIRTPTLITYPVDVRMSLLLNVALKGDDSCALVMSNMISRMPLEEQLKSRLVTSWLQRVARGDRDRPPAKPRTTVDGAEA